MGNSPVSLISVTLPLPPIFQTVLHITKRNFLTNTEFAPSESRSLAPPPTIQATDPAFDVHGNKYDFLFWTVEGRVFSKSNPSPNAGFETYDLDMSVVLNQIGSLPILGNIDAINWYTLSGFGGRHAVGVFALSVEQGLLSTANPIESVVPASAQSKIPTEISTESGNVVVTARNEIPEAPQAQFVYWNLIGTNQAMYERQLTLNQRLSGVAVAVYQVPPSIEALVTPWKGSNNPNLQVTITGQGFNPGTVTLSLKGQPPANVQPVAGTTADSSGDISWKSNPISAPARKTDLIVDATDITGRKAHTQVPLWPLPTHSP